MKSCGYFFKRSNAPSDVFFLFFTWSAELEDETEQESEKGMLTYHSKNEEQIC